jgi:antirestriction protein ArdC
VTARACRDAADRADLYQEVTGRITAALEAGTIPWRQPWTSAAGRPASMSTGRPYRGVNALLLGLAAADRGYASRWWGTYRQIGELGGQVRRGEHSVQVVFWKQLEVSYDPGSQRRDADVDHLRTVPLLRAFRVFNAEQADDLPARYCAAEATAGPDLAGQPQDVLDGYLAAGGPRLVHAAGANPSYDIVRDQITLPAPAQFPSREAYYATAFHEAAHSTGAPHRLNRPGVAGFDHYGSGRYAREELIAEIGGAMLSASTGTSTEASLREDTAAYIAGWLRALGDDRRLVVTAASQAERAADLVLEPQRQAEARPDPEADTDRPAPAASARGQLTARWAATARPYLTAEPEAGG